MKYYPISLLLFLTLATPVCSWADTSLAGLFEDYRTTMGIKINLIDFDVYNENSTSPNGTLSEDFSYSPIFTLGSPYKYFKDSNWGGLMEYSFSGFRLKKQLVNDRLVNLNTSVDGYYAFATPTLFYSFSNNNAETVSPQKIIAGLGIGLGYLKASGNIIFTETTQQLHDIDISGLALAISMFIDYQQDNFVSRISAGMTSHSKNNLDYDAFGFEWDFAYLF